ncbi:DUF2798 domain-containing protein [Chloroflexota bacterium]
MKNKISKRYYGLLFGILMGIFMALVMSFVMTIVNVGIMPNFLSIWLRAFLIGAGVGIPTAIVIAPRVRQIVDKLTE